jgi:hypothetical protein
LRIEASWQLDDSERFSTSEALASDLARKGEQAAVELSTLRGVPMGETSDDQQLSGCTRQKNECGARCDCGRVALGSLGFYLGWFSMSEHREATTHSVNVNLRVDPDKIKHDVRSATERTEQKASRLSNEVKQEAQNLNSRTSPGAN